MDRDRLEDFLAGVLLAVIVTAFLVSMTFSQGCAKQPSGPDTWLPVATGDYVIVMAEPGTVLVSVRLGVKDDRFYWRVSRMVSPPPKERPVPKMMTSRKLDVSKALDVTVPWRQPDDQIRGIHGFWMHQCCDCGSTHRVLSVPIKEGLRMLWWKDELETRKERLRRGFPSHQPWPESLDPSIR